MGLLAKVAGVFWPESRPNQFIAFITGPEREKKRHRVTLDGSGEFVVGKETYKIDLKDEHRLSFVGFWRVPSADYIKGYPNALTRHIIKPEIPENADPETVKEILADVAPTLDVEDDGITAEDETNVKADAAVFTATIRAFAEGVLSPTTSFIIILAVMVIGFGILFITTNNKFRDLETVQNQIAAVHGIGVEK